MVRGAHPSRNRRVGQPSFFPLYFTRKGGPAPKTVRRSRTFSPSMFTKRRWLRRGWIDSDEGFSVAFGRDTLIYRECGRKMSITVDVGAGQANVFTESIGRWDDDPNNRVSDAIRQRIADNIKRALESQGELVVLL